MLTLALAQAYTLSGYAWPPESIPVEVHWTGELDGIEQADLVAALDGAAEAWSSVAPCAFAFELVEDPDAAEHDGIAILLGDPHGELEPGVLAVTTSAGESPGSFELHGQTYSMFPPLRVVLNDGPYWATDAMIDAGECVDQVAVQGMLTHALGGAAGLGLSCAQGEVCDDAEAVATMYWSQAPCDSSWSSLATDDEDGLWAIYGGPEGLVFGCESQADGLTVDCEMTVPEGTQSPSWDFGDGETAEGSAVSHTYEQPGSFLVTACVEPIDCEDTTRCGSTYVIAASADNGDDDAAASTCEGCAGAPGATSLLALLAALATSFRTRRP